LLGVRLVDVLHAVDGLLADFRHPDLLADLTRRALHLDLLAGAGLVHAAAAARIPHPAARLLDHLGDHRAGALDDLGFPATAALLNRLGVVHRLAHRVVALAVA